MPNLKLICYAPSISRDELPHPEECYHLATQNNNRADLAQANFTFKLSIYGGLSNLTTSR